MKLLVSFADQRLSSGLDLEAVPDCRGHSPLEDAEAELEHHDPGPQDRACLYEQGCPYVHDWDRSGRVTRVSLIIDFYRAIAICC